MGWQKLTHARFELSAVSARRREPGASQEGGRTEGRAVYSLKQLAQNEDFCLAPFSMVNRVVYVWCEQKRERSSCWIMRKVLVLD